MNSSGSHLSKEMLDLIKSIGDSRSKQEEDKIILSEVETLKAKIKESNITNKKMKEYLMRAIYIEMLGHDAPFAHFHAVNLTQDKNIMNKRVGYLACNLLLHENSECLIMLVSTLQKDIISTHWLEVCMALITIIKFANSTIMQACTEQIYKLLDNRNEQVRKKAVMCLIKFNQINPSSLTDINEKMRKMLCDFDPSVMGATLNYFQEMVPKNPEQYKDLVSSFVVILKQIIEHKLPKDFDYHRLPAPWLQMKILQILANLGRDDQSASEGMYEILSQVLRRADDTGINVGYAIVYQCLRTICLIYPNPHLLEQASMTISRFLSSESPNLRCTGINGLSLIIQINPGYVTNHQQVIVDCLEENDETLKKNTFDLLYKMTTTQNVEIIVDKMMNYLKVTEVEGAGRKSILFKITELAQLHAPNKRWFIKIMNQLFVNFGSLITDDIVSNFIKIITEWADETNENEFKEFTIQNYTEILRSISSLPDPLVQLIAFIFGEYSLKLASSEEEIESNFRLLEYLLTKTYDNEKTKGMIIFAITKIHIQLDFNGYDFVKEIVERYAKSKNVDLQQKAIEYLRMYANGLTKSKAFIGDSSCRDIVADKELSFLNSYVRKRINEGARVYDRKTYERGGSTKEKPLNLGPYPNQNKLNKISELEPPKPKIGLWTSQGLNDEAQKQVVVPTPQQLNRSFVSVGPPANDIGRKKVDAPTVVSNTPTVGGTKIMQISSDPQSAKQKPDPTTFKPKPIERKSEYDPNKEKKKELVNSIFGGMQKPVEVTQPNRALTKPSLKDKKPEPVPVVVAPSIKNQNGVIVDLLDLGGDTSSVSTQLSETKKNEASNTNIFDIFGTGNSTSNSQPIQTQSSNTPTNSLDDLLDWKQPAQQAPVTQNNVLDLFGSSIPIVIQQSPQTFFNSLEINTEKFGSFWTDCPYDEETIQLRSFSINSVDKYNQIIKSNGVYVVEVINQEVIASCKFRDQIVLIHCTIEGPNLTALVKCFNPSLLVEIAAKLKEILK